ncbi:MAG: Calx-beta domain-containing protein [Panacagrimonas sp.]
MIEGNGSTISRAPTAQDFAIKVDRSATVMIKDLTIDGNSELAFGLFNDGQLELFRCRITENLLGIRNPGTLTITDSTIIGNTGVAIGGGIESFGPLVVRRSLVADNQGPAGGIRFDDSLEVEASTISGNGAVGGLNGSGTLTLLNSTVAGNSGQIGGGISFLGNATITGSLISGNTATRGGGLYLNVANLTLSNSTISGNTATGSSVLSKGGGLGMAIGSGVVDISDSTFSGNHADVSGGGIFAAPRFALRRNLVSGNTAPAAAEIELVPGTLTADEFNVFGHNGLSNTAAFSNFLPDVADRTATTDGTNPKILSGILCPLALNAPGTTRTHIVPTGSPAVNAGGTTCSATDQRGVARPQGTACDAGAFENNGNVCTPAISIAGASITEGNTGTVNLTFKVRLSAPAPAAVRVNFATQDGTARKPGDYVAKTGTLTIAKGKSSGDIAIQVKGDTAIEPNETFHVLLSRPVGATIATGTATGTIKDDDRPVMRVEGVSVTEGNGGQKDATFKVRLSRAATGPVSVRFATQDGTAKKGSDYLTKTGTLTFSSGQSSGNVVVRIKGDRLIEPNETFRLLLSNPVGATLAASTATGTIRNDDSLTLSIDDVRMAEGTGQRRDTPAVFTVRLSGPSTNPVTASYVTSDGTAKAVEDYRAASGLLTFAVGQTSKTIAVGLIADDAIEANETFRVNLSAATGASIADAQGVGTITNDD